jgi:hypothetical protein
LNFDIEAEILKKNEKMKTIEAPRADPKKLNMDSKFMAGPVMDTITSSDQPRPKFAENYQQNTKNLFAKMNSYVNKFETLSQSE